MNYNNILGEISRFSVQAITEDISRLTFYGMCYNTNWADVESYVLPKLLLRWSCAFNDELDINSKHESELLVATILHKYGMYDNTITQNAIKAIDALDAAVCTSDKFNKQIENVKTFLLEKPSPLTRRPSIPKSITFYRAKDVISIQVGNSYYAAYVHNISGINECPIIELYDAKFSYRPTMDDLKGAKAMGQTYNDGLIRTSLHAVYGLKYLPDPANQIHLINACVEEVPNDDGLLESVGRWTVSDLFSIQKILSNV